MASAINSACAAAINSAWDADIERAAAQAHARHLHLDWLNSSQNIALKLLQVNVDKPKSSESLRAITERIHALPQELQDEIHDFTVLAANDSLHPRLFSILGRAQFAHPLPSKIQLSKLRTILHYANKIFQDHDRDLIQTQCQLVRIFAVHKSATVYFLKQLSQNLASYRLLEAAAARRIFMLALECSKLRSTTLTCQDIPRFYHRRFKDIGHLDLDLCIKEMPEFLKGTVVNREFGPVRLPFSPMRHQDEWYIRLGNGSGKAQAIIVMDAGKSCTWLSTSLGAEKLPAESSLSDGGGWRFTNERPVFRDVIGTSLQGVVTWSIGGRDAIGAGYSRESWDIYNLFWKKFNPQVALSVKASRGQSRPV